jgi:hypothetical protein
VERKGEQIGTKEWRNPSLGCDEWGVFDASVKFFPDDQVMRVLVNGEPATLVGFTDYLHDVGRSAVVVFDGTNTTATVSTCAMERI